MAFSRQYSRFRSAAFPFFTLILLSGLTGFWVENRLDATTFHPETTVWLEAEEAAAGKITDITGESRDIADNAVNGKNGGEIADKTDGVSLGGWTLDQQFMDQIGSAVILAHGLGEPVADAVMEADFPVSGDYFVFVRTRNWTGEWAPNEAPGQFQIFVDGQPLPKIFGREGEAWNWESGGTIPLTAGRHRVTVHDLTGFDGRLDALCFSTDPDFVPPNEKSELATFRRLALGLPENIPDVRDKPFDLVVVGGGTAGICAAVSAARLGLDVALIQNRFLLGGNNSSEIRVHLQGLINLPPYPNLGNLVYQFQPRLEGNAEPAENYEDAKKLNFVRGEKGVALHLGTHVYGVEKEGNLITAVLARNVVTGEEFRFRAPLFADCTGDGNLGFLAGADWRMGRESKGETGESTAPDEPDTMTMGASIQWYAVETGAETTFPDLPWAVRFTHESIRPSVHGDWDWETGLNWNQITDAEKIRDHGLRAAYGHWSYMKNQVDAPWAERVKKMKLGWVASTAGKRESRRLMGDVILQEQDIVAGRVWPDATVTTTWAIDLHYPEPENAKHFPGQEFRAICKTIQSPPYAIPYRCFYSRNIGNLFMAGRDISVTHAALGTVRVMRTGAMMGEVVGMAASVCKKHGVFPRDVYTDYFDDLKNLMTVGVAPSVPGQGEMMVPAWSVGLKNLARQATVSVSSEQDAAHPTSERIHDGVIRPDDPESAYASAMGRQHWVRFDFNEPTQVSGLHFVTQDIGRGTRNHYVLQYLDDDRWRDIPESFVKNRHGLDFALTFPPVRATSFRLVFHIDYSDEIFRLWEVELFGEE